MSHVLGTMEKARRDLNASDAVFLPLAIGMFSPHQRNRCLQLKIIIHSRGGLSLATEDTQDRYPPLEVFLW